MLANRRLRELAAPVIARGLLYGSALANLLREDGVVSGALPNREEALVYGARVLGFVFEGMPALRWVACLGLEAWDCACSALKLDGDWRAHRDSGAPLGPLIAAFHPSARVSTARMAAPWEALVRRA